MPARSSGRRGVRASASALAVAGALVAAPSALALPAPHAGGDSAANISLDTPGERVMTRWVADHTGTLATLSLRVKVEGSTSCPLGGRVGYAHGTSGTLRATTHRVLPDGRPDMSSTLSSQQFSPCGKQVGEVVDLPLSLAVTKGQEYATVIANVDSAPGTNWFSTNHLFMDAGLVGANARNERDPAATDAMYGLDPREVVGYSTDGGGTWSLPGGPYGANGGKAFLPTYVQRYTDGFAGGQPYYWASAVSGTVTMTYPKVPVAWTISQLGAFTSAAGSSTVLLKVDGVQKAQATLSGTGMLRAAIAPVSVSAGQTVSVTTTAGSGGLALKKLYADSVFAGDIGLGTSYAYYMEGSPQNAVPVYPLPMYGVSPATTPPPATPPPPAAVDGTDKALGRPATASSTESSAYAPRNASDGLPTTRWSSAAKDGQWWQVDLGASRQVSRVSIDWEAAYASRYRIQTSADGVTFTTAADVTATGAGTKTTDFTALAARYVRIVAVTRGTSWGVSFWDARVLGPADAVVEKAHGMPATASSSESSAYAPALALDGSATTRWSSAFRDGEWWQVDLGRARLVTNVGVDWEAAYASAYRVLTSTDGTTFSTAADATGRAGTVTTSFAARSARWVRIVALRRATSWGASFWEARVSGPAD